MITIQDGGQEMKEAIGYLRVSTKEQGRQPAERSYPSTIGN
jgi:hypothetical protein